MRQSVCRSVDPMDWSKVPLLFSDLLIVCTYFTLHPSGTLLFCGLQMMIWQKKNCVYLFWKAAEKICEIIVGRMLLKWFDRF